MTDANFSGARVIRALASSALGQFLSTAQSLLLVPMFLAAWGDAGYGEWLALTALASYLLLLDLGGQSYIGVRLAQAYAQEKLDEFRVILSEGFSLFFVLALATQALVSAITFSPLVSWDSDARLVVTCYSASVLISIPVGVLGTCFTATGRIVRFVMLGNLARIIQIACYSLALALRVPPPTYAAVVLATSCLTTAITVFDLRRQLGTLFAPMLSIVHLRGGAAHLRGSLEYFAYALSSMLSVQGVLLVIAAKADASSVAAFSTHRAAASLIVYSGSLLRPTVWPELTMMAARGDMPRLREVVSIAVRGTTWIGAIIAAAVCLAAPQGYALWTRAKLELDVPLLFILAGQAVLYCAWSTTSWPLMSTNQPRLIARWSLANAVLTVVVSYACLQAGTGLRGVAAASLAADILCGLAPFPVLAAKYTGESPLRFASDVFRAIACAAPFVLAAWLSLVAFHGDILRLAVFSACSLALAWPAARSLLGRKHLARLVGAVWGRATP
jgi:O-antigen/teichoic acid export membrane protein